MAWQTGPVPDTATSMNRYYTRAKNCQESRSHFLSHIRSVLEVAMLPRCVGLKLEVWLGVVLAAGGS